MEATGRRYGGRTHEQRRAERRARFLQAGLELFAVRGFQATTIEALCAEAGLAARYFYEEYGDREALLRELYDTLVAAQAEALQAALEAAPLELRAQVRAGLTALLDRFSEDERRARILFIEVTGTSKALENHRLEVVRGFRDVQVEAFGRLAAAGELPDRDFTMTAMALTGAFDQLYEDWLGLEDRPPVAALIDELVELYVAALATPRPG
jgi:AcrR family transcriptional regulator